VGFEVALPHSEANLARFDLAVDDFQRKLEGANRDPW
jgi:hypothetical protein